MQLANKVALVTGATSGIGEATARLFAQSDSCRRAAQPAMQVLTANWCLFRDCQCDRCYKVGRGWPSRGRKGPVRQPIAANGERGLGAEGQPLWRQRIHQRRGVKLREQGPGIARYRIALLAWETPGVEPLRLRRSKILTATRPWNRRGATRTQVSRPPFG